jgi:murein DD-endopeptidase MepM/ murein hydrolase activator NlpD
VEVINFARAVILWVSFLTIGWGSSGFCRTEAVWTKLPFNNNYLTSLEISPYGLLAGEFDTRIWLNPPPLNDVYLSRNLGSIWTPLGLTARGIKDLKYYRGAIYAATYYVKNNQLGLFVTKDLGKTWTNIGPKISPTQVDRDATAIYFGGETNGFWVSWDDGVTWTQKLGDGWYGPNVKAIKSSEELVFVAAIDKVYKSSNHGVTLTEIPYLLNKGIGYFAINGDIVFAASTGGNGIYRSLDKGVTWTKLNGFGNFGVSGFLYYKGSLFAGKNNSLPNMFSVFQSTDQGETWADTGFNLHQSYRTIELVPAFSFPTKLFAISLGNGVYTYDLPAKVFPKLQFLDIPWNYRKQTELIDRITAYFDHEYPLLGYGYKKESSANANSTVNFLGTEGSEPTVYYSSHNGTDYALAYGTLILAPADGEASYYYCSACGNTIRINHGNGYESIYMHLQKVGLVTQSSPVGVVKGTQIGKVGMTGNTTGPHLHFQVQKIGKFPDFVVDPYGWQDTDTYDPWQIFSWNDLLGLHQGSESKYLWNTVPAKASGFADQTKIITLGNKTVTINTSSQNPVTVTLQDFIRPDLSKNKTLIYVDDSSFIISAYNFLGEKETDFTLPVTVTIDFSRSSLENIDVESIGLYSQHTGTGVWEPVPTIVDITTKTAISQINHFSRYVLLGEKIASSVPVTEIIISGTQIGDWYTSPVVIKLTINNSSDFENNMLTTFYTLNGETDWKEYVEPVLLDKTGATTINFRTTDAFGNLEETQTRLMLVNTLGKGVKRVIVKDSSFTTQ